MRESALDRAIKRHLDSVPNLYHWKTTGCAQAGVPDRVICFQGRFIGLEVKAPGNDASKPQLRQLELIRRAGGVAAVVRSVDDVRRIVPRS